MALNEDERKKLEETHDATIQIKTVLLGMNGDDGLVGEVKVIAKSHSSLKKSFWTLIGILIGLGILGSGIWANINGV